MYYMSSESILQPHEGVDDTVMDRLLDRLVLNGDRSTPTTSPTEAKETKKLGTKKNPADYKVITAKLL